MLGVVTVTVKDKQNQVKTDVRTFHNSDNTRINVTWWTQQWHLGASERGMRWTGVNLRQSESLGVDQLRLKGGK